MLKTQVAEKKVNAGNKREANNFGRVGRAAASV